MPDRTITLPTKAIIKQITRFFIGGEWWRR
jgi:hypothetical protein